MKTLKILATCALLLIGGQSFAKQTTTPIVFAKGSDCSLFDGDVLGRNFTLNLNANQDLVIQVYAFKPVYPSVKDPKGKLLDNMGSEDFVYRTKAKGKYSVTFAAEDESYPYVEVKFCAY